MRTMFRKRRNERRKKREREEQRGEGRPERWRKRESDDRGAGERGRQGWGADKK